MKRPTPKEIRQARRRARAAARRNDGGAPNYPGNRKPELRLRKKAFKEAKREHRKERRKEMRKREKDPYKKGTPGKAGKKAPFVSPFMTAEDLMEYGKAHGTFRDTLNQLDFALENQRIEGEYEKTQLQRGANQALSDAQYEFAGRGLQHSSVRDAELYDINATSALRQNYLDRQLDTATIQTQTQKVAAQNAWDDFQRGMNQKKVQNAQEIMANTPKWLVDPVKAQGPSGYKPKKIGPKPRRRDFLTFKPRNKPRPGYQQGGGGSRPPRSGGSGGGHGQGNGSGGTPPPVGN